jgi:hypothetical protein
MGYSQRAVASLAGRSEAWVANLMRVEKVKPSTAKLVAQIYSANWTTPPKGDTPTARAAIAKCRRYAEKAGWAGPLDWDNIDTDPEPIEVPTDNTRAQYLLEDLNHLRQVGESPDSAAKSLGRKPASLARLATRHNHHDLARWIEQADRTAA